MFWLKSGDRIQANPVTEGGSSFESASSIYSTARNDYHGDDMVVPSFSPPIMEETAVTQTMTPMHVVEVVEKAGSTGKCSSGRTSPSASSSSSGSYSLNGSCPDLISQQRPPVPSPRHVPCISDDERSVHYSSSGYYESPLEDE